MKLNQTSKNYYLEIIYYSGPILITMLLQNVMGLVDGGIVGLIGGKALAAYGISFFIHFIHMAPLMGLTTSVQSLIEKNDSLESKKDAVNILILSVLISIFYGFFITFFSHFYFQKIIFFMTKDSEVFKLANSYLNIRMLGIFSIGITYSFRGYWNATSRPTLFLYTSILTYLLNFIISFISSKKIGLAGVALGSVLSTVFSVFLNLSLLNYFYKLKWLRINFSNLKSILGQAIPTGLQHFFFALSYVLFFAIIGKIGPNELAAANVLITITLFLIYPAMGIGMTTAYFINKSNSNPPLLNSEFWIKKILIYSVFLFLLTSIPLMFFYKQILSFFIHDQKIFEIAKIPYIYFLATLTFEVIGHIYSYALFNVKKSFEVLVVSLFIQWPGILLFSYLFGTSFQNIWNIQISFRILQSVIFFLLWKKHLKKSNFIQ